MSTGFPFFLTALDEERQALRSRWVFFLLLGVALIVVGILAIGHPVLATLNVVILFGVLLLIGGVVEAVSGLWTRCWGGLFCHLLTGLFYLFLGAVLLEHPGLAAAGFTLVLAMFFVAGGALRMAVALGRQFTGWGWTLVSGVITLILGLLILHDLPDAAFWVIGTFLGIDLIFNGWSWVMLALAARSIPPGNLVVPPEVREAAIGSPQ
jgi:uncharacterized membrane protein HdeD (DUF308 family)